MDNVINLTEQRQISPRPWHVDGFVQTMDNGEQYEHGFMVIAADNETIVASNLSIQHAELICKLANEDRFEEGIREGIKRYRLLRSRMEYLDAGKDE